MTGMSRSKGRGLKGHARLSSAARSFRAYGTSADGRVAQLSAFVHPSACNASGCTLTVRDGTAETRDS